jgi:hypothetical protein
MAATVTKRGFLDMQVCVPSDFTDDQVVAFAEQDNPCGTTNGWQIRRQGSERLSGCDERVPCESREGHVHIMLEA